MVTVVRGRAVRRWALVAASAAAVCAIPSVIASFPVAGAEPGATQLRQMIVDSAQKPYTGYAQIQAELGLPNLPELTDVTGLLSGITAVRLWYRSPSENRVDVIDTLGERDVYQTPDGLYTWDYGRNLLTEVVGDEPVRLPRAGDLVPPDLARRILNLDTTDPVVSLPPRRLAGVTAAGLRLRPTDPATTVAQVDIWADPVTGLPLRIEVTARGQAKPILASQFVDLSQTDPGDAALSPPIDAAGGVSQIGAPNVLSALGQISRYGLPPQLAGYQRQPPLPDLPTVGLYGTGLSSFVVLPLPRDVGSSAIDTATKAGATKLTVTRGRAVLIQIPLLTVLIEQIGYGRRTYLVAGLVDHSVLAQAATELSNLRRPVPGR